MRIMLYILAALLLLPFFPVHAEEVKQAPPKCEMKEEIRLSNDTKFSADSTDALFKQMWDSDSAVQTTADKAGIKGLVLKSQKYDVKMRMVKGKKTYEGRSRASWDMAEGDETNKLFKLLAEKGIEASISITKEEDRSCKRG